MSLFVCDNYTQNVAFPNMDHFLVHIKFEWGYKTNLWPIYFELGICASDLKKMLMGKI